MSVNSSPVSARKFTVGAAEDPYKKYWWGILAGFVLTGLWLFSPMMETPIGSTRVDASAKPGQDAGAAEQSLDAASNPDGAPGGALDLSMDGAARKSLGGDDLTSMLYQAPAGSAAAAATKPSGTAAASSSESLAQQLADAGKKAAGASGWGEKAQRGFDSPRLAGGGLKGLGSLGGGSSASAGGGTGFFGARTAQVGFVATQGLNGDGGAGSADFKALTAAAGAAAPDLRGANETLSASAGRSFDGRKGRGSAPIGAGALAQANAALDTAPADLKVKAAAPTLDDQKPPVPSAPPAAPTAASSSQNMGQELVMMAATAVIGGMIPGVGGQMVMMMGMTMMQQKSAQSSSQ